MNAGKTEKVGADICFNFGVIHTDRPAETVLFFSPEYSVLRFRRSGAVKHQQWDGAHWQSASFLSRRERGRLTRAATAALKKQEKTV